MSGILSSIRDCIWGAGLAGALLGTGAVYTIKLKGIQLRLPLLIKKEKRTMSGSAMRTICMSLGAAMGTGNIAGTAAAIVIGGAGAVFWMWVSAFFGMALVYAENRLSEKFSDNKTKGPAAYLTRGLGSPLLACIFTFSCILASVGMGGMAQTNTFAHSLAKCGDIPALPVAAATFIVILLITSGGAKRIGIAAQYMLPVASAVYGGLCIIVISCHFKALPDVFAGIFREAFGAKQFTGGFAGSALAVGIRRGIFSNEAGLGSSPLLHSSSDSKNSFAAWSMFEVFFDTMICCTLTAVTVLSASGDFTIDSAFSPILGDLTDIFLAAVNGLFALCTVIGWYYCGESSFLRLTRGRARLGFCIVFSLLCGTGTMINTETVWILADIFNGLMALPNLIGLILLMKNVKNE